VPTDVPGALRRLLDYLDADEERDFAACGEEDRREHIWPDMVRLGQWLDGLDDR
jgi:hypothetical protein